MKESQTTEWKRSWRDEYLKWICAFANTDGGVLVIDVGKGVGENVGKLTYSMPVVSAEIQSVIDQNKLSKNEGMVLQMIDDDSSVTILYMASRLGVQDRTVERCLSKLRDLQLVTRIGGAHGGEWKLLNVGKAVGRNVGKINKE